MKPVPDSGTRTEDGGQAVDTSSRKWTCQSQVICRVCGGARSELRILLASGEAVEVPGAVNVEIVDGDVVVTCAAGQPRFFPQEGVYFAGCSCLAHPFFD